MYRIHTLSSIEHAFLLYLDIVLKHLHLTMMICWTVIIILMTMMMSSMAASEQDSTRALMYLMRYGYLAPRNQSSALLTQSRLDTYLRGAVRDFQAFAGVPATGDLDTLTVELMGTPRCGVRDIVGHGATAKRKKRYIKKFTSERNVIK